MAFKPQIRKDEVGVIKDQTSREVVKAAEQVKKGVIYALGTERFSKMPLHPGHPPFTVVGWRTPQGIHNQNDREWLSEKYNKVNLGVNSELVIASMHSGTHIDTLGHITIGPDDHWYNGYNHKDVGDFGILKADGSSFVPVFTRGILLDVAGFKKIDCLPKSYGITAKDLEETMNWEGVSIQTGDTVLIGTGYGALYPNAELMANYHGAGINAEAAKWLVGKGAVVVGADTESLEQIPCVDPDNPHIVHTIFLIETGIYIMEMVNTHQLSLDKVYEFLFVALPLTIRGATASLINPVAIV